MTGPCSGCASTCGHLDCEACRRSRGGRRGDGGGAGGVDCHGRHDVAGAGFGLGGARHGLRRVRDPGRPPAATFLRP